jgi:hypothetical protein
VGANISREKEVAIPTKTRRLDLRWQAGAGAQKQADRGHRLNKIVLLTGYSLQMVSMWDSIKYISTGRSGMNSGEPEKTDSGAECQE